MTAFNRENLILDAITSDRLDSGIFDLTNNQVVEVLMKIVLPKSEEQFVAYLKASIPSKLLQLPPNFQVDCNKWQHIYKFLLVIIKEVQDILAILQSDSSQDYSPLIYSKVSGRPGIIQIFCAILPLDIGHQVHKHINLDQAKTVPSFDQYLKYFKQVSATWNNLSMAFEINSKRIDNMNVLNTSGNFNTSKNVPNVPFVNRDSSYKNNDSRSSSPYKNPYNRPDAQSSHNNLYQLRQDKFDAADSDYNERLNTYNNAKTVIFDSNTYNSDTDENVTDYNFYDDKVDNIADDIVVRHNNMNPMYTDKSNEPPSAIISHHHVYALISETDRSKISQLPCFAAVRGDCREGDKCKFSHNPDILRREFQHQMRGLQSSPFNRGTPGYLPSPASSLKNQSGLHNNNNNTPQSGGYRPSPSTSQDPRITPKRVFTLADNSPNQGDGYVGKSTPQPPRTHELYDDIPNLEYDDTAMSVSELQQRNV
jgi:hypothetical protein